MTQAFRPLDRDGMARQVAADMPDGAYVNLGIGIPTLAARYLPADREVILHSENGIVGMVSAPADQPPDPGLLNASREAIVLVPGASLSDHVVSFTMIRGGHLDISVLGAFEVASNGDIANWDTGEPGAIPAVGGAMDLVVGARSIWAVMSHNTREGAPKIVERCTYPITGQAVVDRVYTDLAVLDVDRAAQRLTVRAMVAGLSFEELQRRTAAPLSRAPDCRIVEP
ncbi:MAG: 3-oxoacid CoA-transferase subunit B [Burkholderiaceae bacterium]